MTGKNNKNTHHQGRWMILSKMMALYTGTIAFHGDSPEALYNLQVPKK